MRSLGILIKNTSALMFAEYFGMGMNFILTIFLARYFGAEGFGIFITAMTFFFFGSIVTDFGIETVFVRNVSRNKSDLPLYYVNGLFLTVLTALISWIGIAIVVTFLGYNLYLKTVILIASSTLFFSAFTTISTATIKALERMELISIVTVISGIVYSIIAIFMVVLGYGIVEIILWGIIVEILKGIALFLFVKKIRNTAFSWKIRLMFCFNIVKQSAPLGILRSLNVITNKVDILMLSAMIGNASVGFYAVAVKIVNFLIVPVTSFNNAFLPHFSAKLSTSKDDISRIFNEIVRVLIILSLPIAILISTIAENIIGIFFGQSFVDNGSPVVLQILIWSFFFDVISGPSGVSIISIEYRLIKFASYFSGLALLNVVLNIFLIPSLGIIGASISTLICSFARFLILILLVYRLMGTEMKIFTFFIKPAICAALFYLIILALKDQNIVLGITSGIVVYFIGLFMLKALTTEDITLIRKLLVTGAGKFLKL